MPKTAAHRPKKKILVDQMYEVAATNTNASFRSINLKIISRIREVLSHLTFCLCHIWNNCLFRASKRLTNWSPSIGDWLMPEQGIVKRLSMVYLGEGGTLGREGGNILKT